MAYPFEVCGRIVKVYRYEATYKEQRTEWEDVEVDGEIRQEEKTVEETVTNPFTIRAEAEATGGTVTELDVSDFEWMDGIEVADVPDTYAEAVRIFEMGQEAYEAELAADPETDRDELLLDLSYRLALLEMGVTV